SMPAELSPSSSMYCSSGVSGRGKSCSAAGLQPLGDRSLGTSLAIVMYSIVNSFGHAKLLHRFSKPGNELFLIVGAEFFPAAHAVSAVGDGDQIADVAGFFHLFLELRRLGVRHLSILVAVNEKEWGHAGMNVAAGRGVTQFSPGFVVQLR